jgi:hypothetical protein
VPQAPVNDEAKKHNKNLPGLGGIFNTVNLHVYHYSFNNPITYIDPDGRDGDSFLDKLKNVVNDVDKYILENKEALFLIAFGGAQIVGGNILKGGSVTGGVVIAGVSGGVGTLAGVALAVVGVSAGETLEVTGTVTLAVGLAMLVSNNTGGGSENYREKTKSANADDRKQIDNIAKEAKIDRREFGDFIEKTKKAEGRGASHNYSYKELQELAKQFKELQ